MNASELQSEMREELLKYQFAKEVLETDLKILLKEYELTNGYNPVEHVKSRIKSSESAIKKLERKGYEVTPSNDTYESFPNFNASSPVIWCFIP